MATTTALRLWPARMQIAEPRTGLPTAEMVRIGHAIEARIGGPAQPRPGSLYVADANGNMVELPLGAPGQVLTVNGAGDGVEWT